MVLALGLRVVTGRPEDGGQRLFGVSSRKIRPFGSTTHIILVALVTSDLIVTKIIFVSIIERTIFGPDTNKIIIILH